MREPTVATDEARRTASLAAHRVLIRSLADEETVRLHDAFGQRGPLAGAPVDAELVERLASIVTDAFSESLRPHRTDGSVSAGALDECPPAIGLFINAQLAASRALALELSSRIENDRSLIAEMCGVATVAPLVDIRCWAGSPLSAATPRILTFRGGRQLVYAPGPAAADIRFQHLLAWLNQHGACPEFSPLSIVDRHDYWWGVLPAASAAPPSSRAPEADRFLGRRLGQFLAICHLLPASDCTLMDLLLLDDGDLRIPVAHGFFQPLLSLASDTGATALITQSVLRLVGAAASEWQQRLYSCVTANREEIVEGFRSILGILLAATEQLVAPGGPLAWHADDVIRIRLRSDDFYEGLLAARLKAALSNRAGRTAGHVSADANWPSPIFLTPAETRAVSASTIPVFFCRADQQTVVDTHGARVATLACCPRDAVRALKRQRLKTDVDMQVWLLSQALTCLQTGRLGRRYALPAASVKGDVRRRLLDQALLMGDRLRRLAIRLDSGVSWCGVSELSTDRWAVTPLGADFYGGLSGIAFFLAYLGKVSGESQYESLAREAIETVLRETRRPAQTLHTLGAFLGWGGVIHVLAHLGTLWRDTRLIDCAESYADALSREIGNDLSLDVMCGVAGYVAGLKSLHAVKPCDRTIAAMTRCGDRLLDRAERLPAGIGWPLIPGRRPLTGFSHGAAGFSWALHHVAHLSGTDRFRHAADQALAYERAVFDAKAENWPDFRGKGLGCPDDDQPLFRTSWCHGAPGIGMARLSLPNERVDATVLEEVAVALRTTVRQGFGYNHALCCGDFGNLDLLLLASARPELQTWRDVADEMVSRIVCSIEEQGHICGLASPLPTETPGLMQGFAGIGYGLLRAYSPSAVPSVLTLEPPRLT